MSLRSVGEAVLKSQATEQVFSNAASAAEKSGFLDTTITYLATILLGVAVFSCIGSRMYAPQHGKTVGDCNHCSKSGTKDCESVKDSEFAAKLFYIGMAAFVASCLLAYSKFK